MKARYSYEQEHPLLTVKGFLKFYDTFLPKTNSVREAYEAAEKEFIAKYNHPRFANFESFMKSRSQYNNKQRQNKLDKGHSRQAA